MLWFLWLFFLFSATQSLPYLDNNATTFSWVDIPDNSLLRETSYPYTGFGCSVINNEQIYFVTSTNPGRYMYNQQYCSQSKKYVEALEYSLSKQNFTNQLLLGTKTAKYPHAVAGKGSDNIRYCGIHKKYNLLYFLSSNIHNCPENNYYDSSIVRINLTDFTFHDRVLLKDIENVPPFSKYDWSKYRYLNHPTTANLLDDHLWLGFGTTYTGILKLYMNETNITLDDAFQKTYMKEDDEMSLMYGEGYSYETVLREIKHSFVDENTTQIYFLEDTGYSDAQLMIINYSKPIDGNNSRLVVLDGINYVSDMKFDRYSNRIYFVTGSLTSELYQYDIHLNKLKISEGCNIDFLKFPTEWGKITNINIDHQTGFIYAPVSSHWGNNGLISINQKDMTINYDSQIFFKDLIQSSPTHSYIQWFNNMNITTLLLDRGLLVISSNHLAYRRRIAMVNLSGCAVGRGIKGDWCSPCEIGTFSNEIGGRCDNCHPGFAIDTIESSECAECVPGKFTNGVHAVYCIDCPNGFYADKSGSNYCVECKNGTYSIIQGSPSKENCVDCPSGKISYSGSQTCEFCPAGKWSNEEIECVDCPGGKYSFTIGLKSETQCKNCPIGKYNDQTGLIYENECKECFPGYIGIVEGAIKNTSCVPCEQGKFRHSISQCLDCDDGFVALQAHQECKICPIGKVSDEYKINCIDCPLGKLGNAQGLYLIDSCLSCDRGRYSNITGISDFEQCTKCPVGTYNLNLAATSLSDCISCPAGKFRNNDMGIECETCPTGKFSIPSSSNCLFCTIGKYAALMNELPVQCNNCPAGKYIDYVGGYLVDSCIDCPAGRYSSTSGLISPEQCVECQVGKYSETRGATTQDTCINCDAGQYNYNNGSSSINECKPCSTGSMSLQGASTCILCPAGKYSELMGSTECKFCSAGKIASHQASLACSDCPDNSEENVEKTECFCISGTYNDGSEGLECKICPDKFTCKKGSTIQTMSINAHYWRENVNTLDVYKCKNHLACKGGEVVNTTNDLCQPGHSGPICDVCTKGWSKDDGVCLKCPENMSRTMSLTILIPVVCIFIIIFLIKTANPANNKKEEVNGVVKIFMNYAQVFSLASSFQINWPALIRYLFERAKEFSSPRVSFYSSDCVLQWGYYDKFIVYLALPLVYIVISTIVIFILSLCYCKRKKKKLRRMSIVQQENYLKKSPSCMEFFSAWEKTAVVVGTFLSWPTIVEKTLEIMNCEKIGEKYYLVKDVSIECYDEKHLNYLIVGYLGLILYGIGIPLLGFRLLYKYRFRLFDMQNRYDGSTPLSFLFLGYREKRWYYEFIIMGKKAGLILLSVFLRNHPRYQIIGASLLIQISFFIHVFLRPYDTITSYGMICNKLESISLLSLVMTLSTGLFFGTIDSGYNLGLFEDILIVILILCNGLLCLYFMVYFVVLAFKSIKNHAKDFITKKLSDGNVPFYCRCCSRKNLQRMRDWGDLEMAEDYGIHLKNQVEKEIFTNYFKEKQNKLGVLNEKIDNIKDKNVSVKLDRLRSQIQVMEKERCWQTIQNNRLYSELKKTVMLNKPNMDDEDLEKLNDLFKMYVEHGIKYNETINDLYMEELRDMIQRKFSDSSEEEIVEMENIIISAGSSIEVEVEVESDGSTSIVI